MLGDLSAIIEALDPKIKLRISKNFGIPDNINTNGTLLPQIILAIKDLRNAIAHNKVIFDGRYIEFKKRNSLKTMIESETGIDNISFDCFIDDVILICFIMKNLRFPKTQIVKIISQIEKSVLTLKEQLPNRLFQQVAGKTIQKLPQLKIYVTRNYKNK